MLLSCPVAASAHLLTHLHLNILPMGWSYLRSLCLNNTENKSKNLHRACEALKDKVGVRAARAAALTIADPIRDKKPDMELTSSSRVSKHCAVHKASIVDNTEILLYNALKHITKQEGITYILHSTN